MSARALGLSLALWAATAGAEEGAYGAFLGGGATVHPTEASLGLQASVLVKAVYGVSDLWNVELPLMLDFLRGRFRATGCSGWEYVYFQTNHVRLNLGAGLVASVPVLPTLGLELGPYAETAVRWQLTWGVGLSVELHAGYLWAIDGASHAPFVNAALALYSEL